MTIVSPKARRVWFTPIGQAVGRCGRRRDRTLEGLPRHLPRPRHPRVASFSRSRRLCCGAPATKVHFCFCSRCQEKTFFLCISMCCTINARNKRARAPFACAHLPLFNSRGGRWRRHGRSGKRSYDGGSKVHTAPHIQPTANQAEMPRGVQSCIRCVC